MITYTNDEVNARLKSLLDRTAAMLEAVQEALEELIKPKPATVGRPRKDAISTSDAIKLIKTLTESHREVYKITHGRAAQEEIIMKIRELQRHLARVESHNAERERRARSRPLMDVVGQLAAESEIIDDSDAPERDATVVTGQSDADLARIIEGEVD
jgi:hypothetical protein